MRALVVGAASSALEEVKFLAFGLVKEGVTMRSLWKKENSYHVAYDIGYRIYSKRVAKLKVMARRQTRHKMNRRVYA